MAKQRVYKGESLLAKMPNYTVVDIETTGMYQAKIIEISALRVRDGVKSASFSMLINPHDSLTNFIKNLTGINDQMLAEADELDVVLRAFYDFVGEDIIVGHNVHFDVNFLYDALEQALDFTNSETLELAFFSQEECQSLQLAGQQTVDILADYFAGHNPLNR